MHRPPPSLRRLPALLTLAALLVGVAVAPAAHAADRGTGFGTWAPLSRTGWHGSMRVGDVHTYCIHPGLPVATGTTTDHGTTSQVNGLSPQQLVSVNYLVSTYGQTDDPVQAASVGWAVKAIVDRDTTLHSWGYGGDKLTEAIDYIMRRASPENSGAIQERTVRYLAEAEQVPVPRVGGSLTLSTDEDDPTRGVVTVDVDATAEGFLKLENAVFADTGSAERTGVRGPTSYQVVAPPSASDGGRPYVVRASGSFTVRSAAIRYYSTPGQQESAGPADPTTFELRAEDASPRPVRFSPQIVTSAQIDARGRFVDQVTIEAAEGLWPRHSDGSFVVVSASADVYRTNAFAAESPEIPANLTPVAHLELRTDPAIGPGTYRTSTTTLPGPGVYTAVWRIERTSQDVDSVPHFPSRYFWMERFATPAQTEQLAFSPPPVDPSPSPTASPTSVALSSAPPAPPTVPAALAFTGFSAPSLAETSGAATLVIALGVLAWRLARRRRASAHA
ncbi:hypothetical protein QE418_000740 [Microbacterium testaceum]|uniref:hypothetical protein n=1 Tax=Microbacterium TaxID=33882 RepID=UPI001AE971BA|nr:MULTISPECIES: hypothetical protein [Microbacterium]MDQ1111292.1 hypothetical protein [Microbacterium testaceum]MDR6098169.1 hypothetical protein [Microbacterium sp. SORGH_AS_0454]